MHKERMGRAIKVLRSLPNDEHFSLGCWLNKGDLAIEADTPVSSSDIKSGCGTTACALGWIAATKEAQADGLRLVKLIEGYTVQYQKSAEVDYTHTGYGAAFHYFELNSLQQACFLFSPISYNTYGPKATPNMVADRIAGALLEDEYLARPLHRE